MRDFQIDLGLHGFNHGFNLGFHGVFSVMWLIMSWLAFHIDELEGNSEV